MGGWAFVIEPQRLVIRHEAVHLPGWPPGRDSVKVAVLSDVHAGGPYVTQARLRAIVAACNAQKPDLVVLLGDYVHGRTVHPQLPPEVMARELGALRGRHQTLAVLGNHDWWLDGERVRAALGAAGIRVLENEAVRVEADPPLWVAGLADLWTRRPDIPAALASVPQGAPVLLLTHNPDVFPSVPARVTLTLAGHTHGGQVDLPLLGRLVVPSRFGPRYADGLVVEDGRMLFVTSGLSTSILPVRFRVPPEIVILTLAP